MGSVWAIADLHLSFGVPDKKMDIFGEHWRDHPDKIERHWRDAVGADDLVLIAGDISWGKELSEAIADLEWIDALPGTKVILRGNHDYWWSSLAKLKAALPPSIHYIQNNVYNWNGISIGGARLWDSDEYGFDRIIDQVKDDSELPITQEPLGHERNEKIFHRELLRLENSLKLFDPQATTKIAMTHYPPIGLDLGPSRAAAIMEKYGVDICVFGHIHNVRREPFFGESRGVRYFLTAADYLDFLPVKIF